MNSADYRYIHRFGYLKKIEPFINKNIIKALIGQRRVGKSYLLYQIIDWIKENLENPNIIYINKEHHDFDSLQTYTELIAYVDKHKSNTVKNYLFIDEVQDIVKFEKAIRHFALDANIDIYITGSNANLLSGELATYLSGRYIEFKIYSLSFNEFLIFHKFDNTNDALKKYMLWGGLPFLKNLEKKEDVISEYLKNIYTTIIYKDIISRFQIRNTAFLENLVHYLASNTGNIISAKKISDYLKSQHIKMSPQIVLNYLHYLKQAMLIFQVKRKEIGGKKVFEINEKFYFEDWGILNSIIGFSNFDVGKIVENIVFIHLKIWGYDVTVGKQGNKEIDFVGERGGEKLYIQACYLLPNDQVKQREFGNLLEIKDNYPKLVVSLDEYAPSSFKGIKHIHLSIFLTQNQ